VEKELPHLRGFADVADVGQAAKDWPQLNFVISHSAYNRREPDNWRITWPVVFRSMML
jgi:predicted TIM-barrel fold metal-dependent hydrolase